MAKKRKTKTKRKKHLAAMKQVMVMSVFEDPDQIWCTAHGGGTSMLNALEHRGVPDQEVDFYSRAFEAGHSVMIVVI